MTMLEKTVDEHNQITKDILISAVFYVFSNINKRVNQLMEENITSLSENFTSIAGKINKLNSEEEGKNGEDISASMKEDISKALMAIQFQDRASQNLEAMRRVSDYIRENLQDNQEKVSPDEAAGEIVSLLSLGELKEEFTNYLISQGAISNVAEVGYNQIVTKENDSVELF